MGEDVVQVVWPSGKLIYNGKPLASRVPDLKGKTVCELYDHLFRGEEIFPLIRNTLGKRYPGIKFVEYEVFGNIHGPEEAKVVAAVPELLRKHGADAVIVGIGA